MDSSSRLGRVADSVDRFITPSRLRGYPIVIGTMGLALATAIIVIGQPSDFLAHWTGGRIILGGNGSTLYDPSSQYAVQDGMLTGHTLAWYVAPPFAAFLYVPFALFGYHAASVLWLLFSASCMVGAAWLVRPLAPKLFREHSWVVYVAMFSTWPVFENLAGGQDAGLCVLLWVAGLRLLMSGRDSAGGAVLALGLIKPQLFFVVPFVLIAQRRWRALGAWAATVAGLGLASIQAVGVQGVIAWVKLPFSDAFHSTVQAKQAWMMQSLPALAESSFGIERVGLVVSVAGFGVLLWQLRRHRNADPVAMWMVALVATFAVTPHVMSYDLIVLMVPILWLLEHHNSRQVRLACLALFVLAWTCQIRHGFGAPFDLAWSAIPIVVMWFAALRASGLDQTAVPAASRQTVPSDQAGLLNVVS